MMGTMQRVPPASGIPPWIQESVAERFREHCRISAQRTPISACLSMLADPEKDVAAERRQRRHSRQDADAWLSHFKIWPARRIINLLRHPQAHSVEGRISPCGWRRHTA
jgi:hypothetical protein